MVLLSCLGTGDDIYTKLANGMARHNRAQTRLLAIQKGKCGALGSLSHFFDDGLTRGCPLGDGYQNLAAFISHCHA
jgi:hypothetical protein